MSGSCSRCGGELGSHDSSCASCGAVVEPTLLPELRPEAEPPLPAAHEALRSRTPPRGVRRMDPPPSRKIPEAEPAPRPVLAALAEPPAVAAPGPLEDPSAWFDEGSIVTPAPSPLVPLEREPAPLDRDKALDELARGQITKRARKERQSTPSRTPISAQPPATVAPTSAPAPLARPTSRRRPLGLLAMGLVLAALLGWWLLHH